MLLPLRKVLVPRLGWRCSRALSVSHQSHSSAKKGLVLGIYENENGSAPFTKAGDAFDTMVSGKLREILSCCGPPIQKGKTRILYGLHKDYASIVVAGLGKESAGLNDLENWNENKENIRIAVAVGCRQLQDLEFSCVEVDPCEDAQAAAEGALLGLFEYNELKAKKKTAVSAQMYGSYFQDLSGAGLPFYSSSDEAWKRGVLYAEGQNLARHLMEAPANHLTPTKFASVIEERLRAANSNVQVHIRKIYYPLLEDTFTRRTTTASCESSCPSHSR